MIAPGKGEGFADIFEGNAFNNGLLPIELDPADWKAIVAAANAPGGAEVTIDLRDQSLTLHPAQGAETRFSFEIPEAERNRLLKGLDAIAETLLNEPAIRAYERTPPPGSRPSRRGGDIIQPADPPTLTHHGGALARSNSRRAGRRSRACPATCRLESPGGTGWCPVLVGPQPRNRRGHL